MYTQRIHHGAAFGVMLLSSYAMGQTPWPDMVIQGSSWHNGVHHYAVTQHILSPGSAAFPVAVLGTADVEFVSGSQVHLAPGFHAGGLSGSGHFHAYINEALGAPGSIVAIAPDPATNLSANVLHVNKWEKVEIGMQLPQAYQDAIDSFFVHYYANPNDPYVATPGNVDPAHDLNPYADDSLQVVMTLTKPDGSKTLKWGFFMREGKWEGTAPTSLPVEDPANLLSPYHIHFRMAPDMEGVWQFKINLAAPGTRTLANVQLAPYEYTGYAFECDPPLVDNHGPLQVNDANRRTLKFEDGTPYFGLGTNVENTGYGPGQNSYLYLWHNYHLQSTAMQSLHSVGGNFARMFLGSLSSSTENIGVFDKSHVIIGCGPDFEFNGNGQSRAWAFDQVLDAAKSNGIYFQLCITPYPPITNYQTFAWMQDPFMMYFVEPRDSVSGLANMKRYFYSNGNPATANTPGGAFYYWKRKYKYIMNRWGYSVNIPIIEPFNEIDQMLTYQHVDLTDYWTPVGKSYPWAICPENRLDWPADPELPGIISQWVTDIVQYVRGPVDVNDAEHSPLGANKLFLLSYALSEPYNPNAANLYLPFNNPNLDLIDAHQGFYWGEGELSMGFDKSRDFRNDFPNLVTGQKRPFHQGESNYYQLKDKRTPGATTADWFDAAMIYDNYDISFHNELWSSTFFGNFAAATTWQKERVFWWEHNLPQPPSESPAENPLGYTHTKALWAFNTLKSNGVQVQVQNRPLYHNFKPLADLLANPNWQAYGFFNGEFDAHKVYDEENGIEAYYLTSADQPLAIGWVHNLRAYWENHYYVKNQTSPWSLQNFFGCTRPDTQLVSIPGLPPGMDYHITWFPTRMNDTIHPADAMDTTRTGTVLLDMRTAPLGDTANLYIDTLHLDYAFIISPQLVLRSMLASNDEEVETGPIGWDYVLFPNPASEQLHISLPADEPADIAFYDLAGRWLRGWSRVQGPQVQISINQLARGAYYVRVSTDEHSRVKPLIIR